MSAHSQLIMTLKAPKTNLLCSTRLNLAFIGFVGLALLYAMRFSLSFTIVCMVNSTKTEANTTVVRCAGKSFLSEEVDVNSQNQMQGDLTWSKEIQGYVLSSFFWGYMCSQILGGYLAGIYGSRIIVGGVVLFSSLLTLISPPSAAINVYSFIAIRALLGFFQGATFPAFHTMWSNWAPPLERSLLTGVNYAGGQIGNMLAMPLSAFLCQYGFAGGWPSIFYVIGISGLLWCLVWFYYATNSPSHSRRISRDEMLYIESSLEDTKQKDSARKKVSIPWSKIFTSIPVWATFIGHFAGDWGAYMIGTSLPVFMSEVFGFTLSSLGIVASIPYLAYFIFINIGGILTDKLRDHKILSTIATRRLAMCVAFGGQTLFLLATGYLDCSQGLMAVVFLTLSTGISGMQYAGFVVNYLDIAPQYAGSILGVGNTFSCVAGILAPMMVGWLTPNRTKEEWQLVFWVTGAILITGMVIFSLFAKGEVLPWADGEEHAEKSKKMDKETILKEI